MPPPPVKKVKEEMKGVLYLTQLNLELNNVKTEKKFKDYY